MPRRIGSGSRTHGQGCARQHGGHQKRMERARGGRIIHAVRPQPRSRSSASSPCTMKIISWNIARRPECWERLLETDADVALLQEAAEPPPEIAGRVTVNPAPWYTAGADTARLRPWRAAVVRLTCSVRRAAFRWGWSPPVMLGRTTRLATRRADGASCRPGGRPRAPQSGWFHFGRVDLSCASMPLRRREPRRSAHMHARPRVGPGTNWPRDSRCNGGPQYLGA